MTLNQIVTLKLRPNIKLIRVEWKTVTVTNVRQCNKRRKRRRYVHVKCLIQWRDQKKTQVDPCRVKSITFIIHFLFRHLIIVSFIPSLVFLKSNDPSSYLLHPIFVFIVAKLRSNKETEKK